MNTRFTLTYGDTQRKLGFGPPAKPAESLTNKYRPRQLNAMVGQGEIVWRLESFLEAPYSAALLFDGPTGVGKTTAALALAAELGAVEFGGLEQIGSGMQDADAVARVLDSCRYTPMLGSGWKCVIVDETDYMSVKASQLWLSALEDLPPKTVVVFTTNQPGKFSDRFLDRCERFTFASDATTHRQDAQSLASSIWSAEGMQTTCPDVNAMAGLVDASGAISYRRVVRALEPLLAQARLAPKPPACASPTEPPACTGPTDTESELDAMIVAQVDAMLAQARAGAVSHERQSPPKTARKQTKAIDLSPIPFDDDPADNIEADLYEHDDQLSRDQLPHRGRRSVTRRTMDRGGTKMLERARVP